MSDTAPSWTTSGQKALTIFDEELRGGTEPGSGQKALTEFHNTLTQPTRERNERALRFSEEYGFDLDPDTVGELDYGLKTGIYTREQVNQQAAARYLSQQFAKEGYRVPYTDILENIDAYSNELFGGKPKDYGDPGFGKAFVDRVIVGFNNTIRRGSLGNALEDAEFRGDTELVELIKKKLALMDEDNSRRVDPVDRPWYQDFVLAAGENAPYMGAAFLGGLAGGGFGAFLATGVISKGTCYLDLREKNIEPDIARKLSLVDGILNGAIEMWLWNPLTVIGKVGGSGSKIAGKVTAALGVKGVWLKQAANLMVGRGIQVAGESLEEGAQSIADNAIYELAVQLQNEGINEQEFWKEVWGRGKTGGLPEAVEKTLSNEDYRRQAAEQMKAAIGPTLVFGIPDIVVGAGSTITNMAQLRDEALGSQSKVDFIKKGKKNEVFDDVPEADAEKSLGKIYDTLSTQRDRSQALALEEARHAKGITEGFEERPVDAEGNPVDPAEMPRDRRGKIAAQIRDKVVDGAWQGDIWFGDPSKVKEKNAVGKFSFKQTGENTYEITEVGIAPHRLDLYDEMKRDVMAALQGKNPETITVRYSDNVETNNDTARNLVAEGFDSENLNEYKGKDYGVTLSDQETELSTARQFTAVNPKTSAEQMHLINRMVYSAGKTLFGTTNAREAWNAFGFDPDHIFTETVRPQDYAAFFERALDTSTSNDLLLSKLETAGITGETIAKLARGQEPTDAQRKIFDEYTKGFLAMVDDQSRKTIYLAKKGDFSTVVHEIAHGFRPYLQGDILRQAEAALGVTNGQWTLKNEEAFAEAFEAWTARGEVRDKRLVPLFEQIAEIMRGIYAGIKGIIGKENPKMAGLFEQLMQHAGEDQEGAGGMESRESTLGDGLTLQGPATTQDNGVLEAAARRNEEWVRGLPAEQREAYARNKELNENRESFDKNNKKSDVKPVIEGVGAEDIAALQTLATEGHNFIRDLAHSWAEKWDDTELGRPGFETRAVIKSETRAIEKHIEEETPYNEMLDMVGFTVVVKDIPTLLRMAGEVREDGAVVRVKDRYHSPLDNGYMDILLNIRAPNGFIGEIQLNIGQMYDAKEKYGGHSMYEAQRELKSELRAEKITQKQKDKESATLDFISQPFYGRALGQVYAEAQSSASSLVSVLPSFQDINESNAERLSVLSALTLNKLEWSLAQAWLRQRTNESLGSSKSGTGLDGGDTGESGVTRNSVESDIGSTSTSTITALAGAVNNSGEKTEKTELSGEIDTSGEAAMAETYAAAPKLEGRETSRTLNGKRIRARYTLIGWDGITPSHDARQGFTQNGDYWKNSDGTSLNRRNYEDDRSQQAPTLNMAGTYNGQALGGIMVYHGGVISGNGRTQAGQLAARQGTDGEYIADLLDRAEEFGFTREQAQAFLDENGGHAALVLDVTDDIDVDTNLIAEFNLSTRKAQSPLETAVNISKQITPETVTKIAEHIAAGDDLNDLYKKKAAMLDIFNTLAAAKLIGRFDMPLYFSEEAGITNAGRELLETVFVGSVLDEGNIRALAASPALRQKIVRAVTGIVDNKAMGPFSLIDEINEAVKIACAVDQKVNARGQKIYGSARDYANQNTFNFENQADVLAAEMALALEGQGQKGFADLIEGLNYVLAPAAGGQVDMFGVDDKRSIVARYLGIKGQIQARQAANDLTLTDTASTDEQKTDAAMSNAALAAAEADGASLFQIIYGTPDTAFQSGLPVASLDNVDDIVPAAFWTDPQRYGDVIEKYSYGRIRDAIKAVKNDKNATVKMFQAVPGNLNVIFPGAVITPSADYARSQGVRLGAGAKVISQDIKVTDIHWDGASINEFSYGEPAGRVLFQIAGELGAKNLDEADETTLRMDNLAIARQMEEAGKDAKAVRLASGWERGADGKWRYEIADNSDKIDFTGLYKTYVKHLGDIYDNSELFNAYPDLKNLPVIYDPTLKQNAYYNPGGKIIEMGAERIEDPSITLGAFGTDPETLIHEIQHIIQDSEGFARGGSPRDVRVTQTLIEQNRKKVEHLPAYKQLETEAQKDLFIMDYLKGQTEGFTEQEVNIKAYKSLSGEVEARNAQTRMGLTPQQRLSTLLADTEDVAREDQLFLRGGLASMAMANEIREDLTVTDENLTAEKADDYLRSLANIDLTNMETGITAQINKNQRNKLTSNAAVQKSIENGFTREQHYAAAAKIDKIWKYAIEIEERADKGNDVNVKSIKRFVAPVRFSRDTAYANILLKESVEHGHRIYTVELQEINKLRGILGTPNNERTPSRSQIYKKIMELTEKVNPNNPSTLFQLGYHGSPYRFDRFDSSHMGEGEGNQAFGWGHYFASQREVANFYREVLSSDSYFEGNRKLTGNEELAAAFLFHWDDNHRLTAEEAIQRMRGIITPKYHEEFQKLITALDTPALRVNQGQLYGVDIPDDDELLDWDRPLAEQPEKVKEALKNVLTWETDSFGNISHSTVASVTIQRFSDGYGVQSGTVPGRWNNLAEAQNAATEYILKKYNGQMLYSLLSDKKRGPKAASQYLNSLGIKGVRYLDGASRTAGEGSHNYVIFDDNEINITQTFFQFDIQLLEEAANYDTWEEFRDSYTGSASERDNAWFKSFHKDAVKAAGNTYFSIQGLDDEGPVPMSNRIWLGEITPHNFPEMLGAMKAAFEANPQTAEEADQGRIRWIKDRLFRDLRELGNLAFWRRLADQADNVSKKDYQRARELLRASVADTVAYRSLFADLMEKPEWAGDLAELDEEGNTNEAFNAIGGAEDISAPEAADQRMKAAAVKLGVVNPVIAKLFLSGDVTFESKAVEYYEKGLAEAEAKAAKREEKLQREIADERKDLRELTGRQWDILASYEEMKTAEEKLIKLEERQKWRNAQGVLAGTGRASIEAAREAYNTALENYQTLALSGMSEKLREALARRDELFAQRAQVWRMQQQRQAFAEYRAVKKRLVSSIMRKVKYQNTNYDQAWLIKTIQSMVQPALLGGLNQFLGSLDPVGVEELYYRFRSDGEFRESLLAKMSERNGGKLTKLLLKNLEEFTEDDYQNVIKLMPKSNWIADLDLQELLQDLEDSIPRNLRDEFGLIKLTPEAIEGVKKALSPELFARIEQKAFGNWTVSEAAELAEVIDDLYRQGREEWRLKEEARFRWTESTRNKIAALMKKVPKSLQINADDTPEEAERKRRKFEALTGKFNPLRNGGTVPKNSIFTSFFDINVGRFSKYLGGGVLYDLLYRAENTAFNAEARAKEARAAKIHKIMSDTGITLADLEQRVYVDNFMGMGRGRDFSVDDLLFYLRGAKNSFSRDALQYGNLFVGDQKTKDLYRDNPGGLYDEGARRLGMVLQAAEQFFAKPENQKFRTMADAIGRDYDGNGDRLNRMMIDVFNTPMGVEGYYVKMIRQDSLGNDNPAEMLKEFMGQRGYGQQAVGKGQTKERVKIPAYAQTAIETGLYKTWFKSLDSDEHLIAYGALVRDLNALFNGRDNATMVTSLRDRYGEAAVTYIKEYIGELANPNKKLRQGWERIIREARGKTATAYLAWRLPSVLKQLITSPWPYLQEINPVQYIAAAFRVAGGAGEVNTFIRGKSAYMASRLGGDPMFTLIREEAAKRAGKTGLFMAAVDKFNMLGMKGLEWADWTCVAPGWLAVYERESVKLAAEKDSRIAAAAAEYMIAGMSEDAANQRAVEEITDKFLDDEAVFRADEVVRNLQPSSRKADQAPMFKNKGELAAALLQFQTALNVIWQNVRYDIPRYVREGQVMKAVGTVTGYAMAGLCLGLLAGLGDDDEGEDDPAKKARRRLFYSVTQYTDSVPLIGSEVTSLAEKWITGKSAYYGDRSLLPVVQQGLGGLSAMPDMVFGDTEEKRMKALQKVLSSMGTTAGLVTGFPVSGIKDLGKAAGIGSGESGLDFNPLGIINAKKP